MFRSFSMLSYCAQQTEILTSESQGFQQKPALRLLEVPFPIF